MTATKAVLEERLLEERWLLRDSRTLVEHFGRGGGRQHCKLCEAVVPMGQEEKHLAKHKRQRERLIERRLKAARFKKKED